VAISILAEIVTTRTGRPAAPRRAAVSVFGSGSFLGGDATVRACA
jgi:hypothetical protein